jgi:hypothetical protein
MADTTASDQLFTELERFWPITVDQMSVIEHGLETGQLTMAALHDTAADGLQRLLDTTGIAASYAATRPVPGPCPDWCELPAGHPYEDASVSDVRYHQIKIGAAGTTSVEISADETLGADGQVTITGPRVVVLAEDDFTELDAATAGQLGWLLSVASGKLTRIGGQQR